MVFHEAGYLYGFHYPKYIGKGKEAVQVMYNINLASAKTIALYKYESSRSNWYYLELNACLST